ncbi:hypothetical protein ACVIRM_005406 [Rhizobium laguerreae]|nr:hypothetical protein [Rhizobium laguerreae]
MTLATLVEMVQSLIRSVAQPTFVQTVIRVALAVPFWRSGVLKWDGFLQLNDTANTPFTDEFMLHLPGGALSGPRGHGFSLRRSRDRLADPSGTRLRHPLCWRPRAVHGFDCRIDRARRMADPYYPGCNGTIDYGLRSGKAVGRHLVEHLFGRRAS